MKYILIIPILLGFYVTDSLAQKPVLKSPGELLAPIEGYHSHSGSVWIVVRGTKPPEVSVDGTRVTPAGKPDLKGVGHYRLDGIKPGGSSVDISAGGKRTTLKVLGSSAPSGKPFHNDAFGPCAECHRYSPDTCRKCHTFGGHKHAEQLKCLECHVTPGTIPVSAAARCRGCHKVEGDKSHRKLKHPLTANADPKRPGKVFECVSCHNPHMPKCLSGMEQQEMREWCKTCHSR